MAPQVNCLLIEDDEDHRWILNRILQKCFACSTRTAATGEMGLIHCSQWLPDIIFLDWNLPGMTGMEFLNELRLISYSAKARVIMCTGESSQAKVREALENGVVGYLVKPFGKESVIKQMTSLGFRTKR